MENLPNDVQPDDARVSEYLRERAVRALTRFGAKDRGRAEQLLPMWAHYDMLTDEDREHVLDAFGGPRRTTDVPCPDWCVVDHAAIWEDSVHQCCSRESAVPTVGAGELTVTVTRIIDLELGEVHPVELIVEDVLIPVDSGVRLAEALIWAADLAEGHHAG